VPLSGDLNGSIGAPSTMVAERCAMKLAAAAALAAISLIQQSAWAQTPAKAIDGVFAKYSSSTPGCAVGVERVGQPVLMRAYGSSDLEHGIPIVVDSVFEAGSVSKQFTAAAVLLLAREGKLALEDDVRKYIPELPDYGHPITVDELLSHTSGLRDWGDVEAIAGWPRGDRIYSMADVLDVAKRQHALNFEPGTAWSYTNTGYNLLAIIVERVSGKSLPAFSRERIFIPLGMTRSQWRDDFRRVVSGRAIAYGASSSGYQQEMPFENAIGNGGLLTTVGDLLIWNQALNEAKLGPYLTTELQRISKLNDGRPTEYARGLFISPYRGFREISHSGATAGYRAWLGRYPDQGLSIAMLCNAGDARTEKLAHALADLYLPDVPPPPLPSPRPTSLAPWAGLYADDRSGSPLQLVWQNDHLQSDGGSAVEPSPNGSLQLGGAPVTLLPDGRIQIGEVGDRTTFTRANSYAPTRAELEAIVGRYRSVEAEAVFIVSLEENELTITVEGRPEATALLKPAYNDAFVGAESLVRLVRDSGGRVTALRLSDDRVWDLRADREN